MPVDLIAVHYAYYWSIYVKFNLVLVIKIFEEMLYIEKVSFESVSPIKL